MKQQRFRVDNAIFNLQISKHAKLVYLYLCRCADKSGASFPSIANIAWSCSISERSVQKAILLLENLELVAVKERKRKNGSQCSNAYYVAIVDKQWFYAPDNLFFERISANAKLVYLYLCRMAGKEATSYPCRKTIAPLCGISLTTLARSMRELTEAKLIEKETRFRDNGGQSSNLYTVIEPKQQEKQSKLPLSIAEEVAEKETKLPDNSLAALHKRSAISASSGSFLSIWLGGLSKYAPLEGTPTWGTEINRKRRIDVLSNLVPLTQTQGRKQTCIDTTSAPLARPP